MIIDIKGNEVFGTLSQKSGQSSISSEKMHKIIGLLTSQYSDPIGSMLREYTSNIHDSYIGTGKSPKGIVSLWKDSKKNQDYLSFIDNGSGISPEMFEKIFIVYGESTKDHDNEAIGGFGLGSKTAFAYTDSFSIITRFEGKKYTYYYYKGEKGIPQYDLLSTINTDEENGTEIKIPIKASDVYRVKESKKQLMYFNNIYLEGFNHDNDYKIIEGTNFKIKQNSQLPLHVCLEKVYYPLPQEFLDFASRKYNIYRYDLNYISLALKFKNGELLPTISRENFEYNEKVRDLLFERFNKAIQELKVIYLKDNKEQFKEDDPIVDFINAKKKTTVDISFEDFKFSISNSILKLHFSHALIDNNYSTYHSSVTSLIIDNIFESFKIKNGLSKGKLISVNKDFLNDSHLSDIFIKDERIINRSAKAAYIRENFSNFIAIEKSKPSLEKYKKTILRFVKKENWRKAIINFQKCIENFEKSFIKYSEIEVPTEFIEEYKNRNKKVKPLGEDFKYSIYNTSYYENKNNESSFKNFLDVYKKVGIIYGGVKDAEKLEEIANSSIGNYRCISIRKKDFKLLENNKKFIHVDDLKKIENIKILRSIVRNYQIFLLNQKQYNIKVLKEINDELYDQFIKYKTNYSTSKNDLGESLYNLHPEYRDSEIKQFTEKLDKYFEGLDILRFVTIPRFDYENNWNANFQLKKATLDFLKGQNKKVNPEFYLKLSEEEEEWLKEWEDTNKYFLENTKKGHHENNKAQENHKIIYRLNLIHKNNESNKISNCR